MFKSFSVLLTVVMMGAFSSVMSADPMEACMNEPLLPLITALSIEAVEASFIVILFKDALMSSITGEHRSVITALSQFIDRTEHVSIRPFAQ